MQELWQNQGMHRFQRHTHRRSTLEQTLQRCNTGLDGDNDAAPSTTIRRERERRLRITRGVPANVAYTLWDRLPACGETQLEWTILIRR